jgi:hypothetical protein
MSLFSFFFKDKENSKRIQDLEKELSAQQEQIVESAIAVKKLFDLNVQIVKELENLINFINSKSQSYKPSVKKDEDFYN